MKNIYILFILTFFNISYGQVLISNDKSENINENAILELRTVNSSKGILLPKVALNSLTSSSPLPNHIAGMIVYDTVTFNNNDAGFYYNDGTKWNKLGINNSNNIGDIKYSAETNDHNGWYLLDGRTISSINSTIAINNANNLGFTNNLPDTRGKFLKGKNSSETIGSSSGSSNITLAQTYLPKGPYSGANSTSTDGAHTHTLTDRATGSVASVVLPNGPANGALPDSRTSTTASAGAHTHSFTFSYTGENNPITISPKYLLTNIFVYLGE